MVSSRHYLCAHQRRIDSKDAEKIPNQVASSKMRFQDFLRRSCFLILMKFAVTAPVVIA